MIGRRVPRIVARVELHDTIVTVSVSPSVGRAYLDVHGVAFLALDRRELHALRNALRDAGRAYDVDELRAAIDDATRALDRGDDA